MEERRNDLILGTVAGVADWLPMWSPLLQDLHRMNFFKGVCACMHFCKHVPCVCLHGVGVCIIVFSAWLAVPVCACVQVAHDPGSAGRSVSFMSPVQFSLKSGSKDERVTLIRYDMHTHTSTDTHAGLFEKWLPGDLSGNKVALWRTLRPTTFEMYLMQQ